MFTSMRGYYVWIRPAGSRAYVHHLLSLPHVTNEDRETLSQALARCEVGLNLADALRYARGCAMAVAVLTMKIQHRKRDFHGSEMTSRPSNRMFNRTMLPCAPQRGLH